MESFVFIHGSSDGQSVFVPTNADSTICNEIADKYFRGREPRRRESSAQLSMFVDLYKSSKGNLYCLYSLVNNDCRGANDREGQYFAMTVACKGFFIYPEAVYRMLYAAYMQMFNTNKIIGRNEKGEDQYIISQLKEEKDYLSAFSKKVEEAFLHTSNGQGKSLNNDVLTADYDSWRGVKVNIDMCNSMATYKSLCEKGRIYISEEYESLSQRVKTLETQIKHLKDSNLELEQAKAEAKRSERSKVQDEIEKLNRQIKEKDANIETLSKENTRYKTTIEMVRRELGKYEKIGKTIHEVQENRKNYETTNKKDILKICLLFIILFITLITGLMNYAFFRSNSPHFEEKEVVAASSSKDVETESQIESSQETQVEDITLVVSNKKIEAEAEGGTFPIKVTTNGEWNVPTSPNDWISFRKDTEGLVVEIKQNDNTQMRKYTFLLTAGKAAEQQITITQAGKTMVSENPNYNIVVRNSAREEIKAGSTVQNGDTLYATVTNPNMAAQGYGWKYWNCNGDRGNRKEVTVTVVYDNNNDDIIISYGNLSNNGYRERFRLKKVKQAQNDSTKTDSVSSDSTYGGS